MFERADAYERYVGRWSRRIAPEFAAWLAVPPGGRWLDVGCGTGAFTEAILGSANPGSVVGVDPSSSFIEHARSKVDDSRASFTVGDAMKLDLPDSSFDAAAAALVLNFVPDPISAVVEMTRVVRPGGRVGAYVWDYADGMRMMRVFWDAAVELDPSATDLDEGRRFEICRPERLRACFQTAGLAEISVRPLDVEMSFAGFDDYWSPFLGGQAPAPAYAMSLDSPARVQLAELIRSRLPAGADGTIQMTSRAWAVKGTVGSRAADAG